MSLLYAFLKCLSNCFKHLRIFYIVFHLLYLISVFFEIKKKNSIFCLKLFIYYILFSYVGLDVRLDCDRKNTILLFSKRVLYFFPLWNCTLGFFVC